MKTQDRIKAKDRRPRNPDGTLRRSGRAAKLTNRSLIVRWVEAESVKLKRLGNSFTTIAAHITAVGRGQEQPVTPGPDVQFSSSDAISAQGCHKAYHTAMDREPAFQGRNIDG